MSIIPISFEARHKGTGVISSTCLKPSWARDGKTFICRHNYKKRACVFRKAEQSRAKQKKRERGPKHKTEPRSPKTPTQTSESHTLWLHGSYLLWMMSTDDKNTTVQTLREISKSANEAEGKHVKLVFCLPFVWQSRLLQRDTLNANSDHKDDNGVKAKWKIWQKECVYTGRSCCN